MSTAIASSELAVRWESPAAQPLDEVLWSAWVAKGREQERRTHAKFLKLVKWTSIAALVTGAGLGSLPAPFEVIVRFVATAGAILLMVQCLSARHYAMAAVFGVLTLLSNPLAPVLSFSSEWQRVLILASAAPFAASLAWRSLTEPPRA